MNEISYKKYKLIDTDEYEIFDEYDTGKDVYVRKNPKNINIRDNENKFMFKINFSDVPIDIAEEIAYKIAKKIGISCCKAETCMRKRNSIVPERYDTGVRSFYHISNQDKFITSSSLVSEYLFSKKTAIKMNSHSYDIDLIMQAIFHRIIEVDKRPYQEFLDVKQQFIDMVIFDLKFGNYDRGRDNWMLVQNAVTRQISLYPMYDNEAILAFDSALGFSSASEVAFFNDSNKYPIIRPSDRSKGKSNYMDLLKYLLEKYPVQTRKATDKVFEFRFVDLENLLEDYDVLSEERKKAIKKAFLDRDFKFKYICKKNLEKETKNQHK